MGEYRIGELVEKAGVTKRTIHYYISRGLLPPSKGMGVQSTYNDEHLVRILFIKKLQERYLPLDRIKDTVTSMTYGEICRVLEASDDTVKEIAESPRISMDRIFEEVEQLGTEYIRVSLGEGIELSYPKDLSDEMLGRVRTIVNYSKKIIQNKL